VVVDVAGEPCGAVEQGVVDPPAVDADTREHPALGLGGLHGQCESGERLVEQPLGVPAERGARE
jgi:hypothetical protein